MQKRNGTPVPQIQIVQGHAYDGIFVVGVRPTKITSRNSPDLKLGTFVTKKTPIGIPIMPANMPSASGPTLWRALANYNTIYPAPRHAHKDAAADLRIQSDWVREFGPKLWLTLGIDDPDASIRRAEALLKVGKVGGVIVDPLIGFSKASARMIKRIKRELGKKTLVMAGNVCVPEGVEYLIEAGADCIKIGMGPGAACTTRGVTGIGVPQFTAVLECAAMANRYGIPSIADGGIEGSRELVLALAAGAWAVMSGKLFTQCEESPAEKRAVRGKPGQFEAHYMGLASAAYQDWRGRRSERTVPEGVDFWTPVKYTVHSLMDMYLGGLKSAAANIGVETVAEFRDPRGPVVKFYIADYASARESGIRPA